MVEYNLKCKICNKEFKSNVPGRKMCDDCKQVELLCSVCNKHFIVRRSRYNPDKIQTCSKSCTAKLNTQKYQSAGNCIKCGKYTKHRSITQMCSNCFKETSVESTTRRMSSGNCSVCGKYVENRDGASRCSECAKQYYSNISGPGKCTICNRQVDKRTTCGVCYNCNSKIINNNISKNIGEGICTKCGEYARNRTIAGWCKNVIKNLMILY